MSYALVDHSDALSILLQWMERRRRDAEQVLQKELYQLRRQWIGFVRHLAPYDLFHTDYSALPGGTIYENDYNNRNFIVKALRSRLARQGQSLEEWRDSNLFYAPGYGQLGE